MKIDKAPVCPHCRQVTDKYETPLFHFADGLGWGTPFLYVCFNEECSLYVRGKKQLLENYGQAASYRYIIYPDTGLEDVMVAANPKFLEKRMELLKSVPDDSKE